MVAEISPKRNVRRRGTSVNRAEIGSVGYRLLAAQLGIKDIPKRITEQIESEHSQRNRYPREDRYPRRALGEFLGATLEHETPSRYWLLHTQAEK